MSSTLTKLITEIRREIATTRRMLERAPEDRFDWRPHPKSMSLGDLAAHLAEILWWQTVTLERDEFDFSLPRERRAIPESTAAFAPDV